MLFENNHFDWFCTLTFDDSRINRNDDNAVYDAYEKYINNISHMYPSFCYITFLERHKKDNSIHFHILIGGLTPKQLGLENTGKVVCHWATRKNGVCSLEYFNETKHLHTLEGVDGFPVYNVTNFPYGFTTATRIMDEERCKNYVKKYVKKAIGGSTSIFKNLRQFFYSRNLKLPEIFKYIIGADFDEPCPLTELNSILNDPLLLGAYRVSYNDKYNVIQYYVSELVEKAIQQGYKPVLNEMMPDRLPFNGYQEYMDDFMK